MTVLGNKTLKGGSRMWEGGRGGGGGERERERERQRQRDRDRQRQRDRKRETKTKTERGEREGREGKERKRGREGERERERERGGGGSTRWSARFAGDFIFSNDVSSLCNQEQFPKKTTQVLRLGLLLWQKEKRSKERETLDWTNEIHVIQLLSDAFPCTGEQHSVFVFSQVLIT